MNRQTRCVAVLLFLATCIAAASYGEPGPSGFPQDILAAGTIMVRVWGPNHETLRQQAVVNLYAVSAGVPIQTMVTSGASMAVLSQMPTYGHYTVEVVSAEYQTQRQDVDYSSTRTRSELDFTMQPVSPDGKPVAPGVLVPAISSKALKHAQKGLAEFQAGKYPEALKDLTDAYNAAPNNSDICYLLGATYLRTKDTDHAVIYLDKAIANDPKNVQALVALGQLRHQQGDYSKAAEPLEKAASLDSTQWLARWLLADIHLRLGDYEKALQEAKEAVELGKGAANKAEFVEGEALVHLGQREEAVKVFETFVHDQPDDPAAPAARTFIAKLQAPPAPVAAPAMTSAAAPAGNPAAPAAEAAAAKPGSDVEASTSTPGPTDTTPRFEALLPPWEPQDVDQAKTLVAEGVVCPADRVIEGAGKSVAQLVESVNNITASEKVVYEDLNALGRPISVASRKYEYLAYIEDNDHGLPIISETRDETSGIGGSPQHMSLFALQDLALIFHPQIRKDFQMTCEGLGKWQEKATWVVYFRQRPDHPRRVRSYTADGRFYSAGLKGRAWISADTLQIVRMEADLISPIPEVGLGSEEDVILYGPVDFQSKKMQLWLPMTADIYFYFHHRPFRRHHDFTGYKLFSVGASQKIAAPKVDDDK